MRSMRNLARSMEPHPFGRLPVSTNSQAADWGRQARRVGSQASLSVLSVRYREEPSQLTVLLGFSPLPSCSWAGRSPYKKV